METIPTCLRPTNLTATATTTNSISVSWTPGVSETSWDIIYGALGFDPETEGTTIPSVTSNPYTITGLTSTTTYEIYVRAICGANDVSNWSNSLTASTTMVPEALPYQTDFTTDQSWMMNNGAAPNYWMMGTPSGATGSALFVTNDGTSAAYTITSASVAMAEKLFTMPAGDSVHVVFDVQVGGEGTSTPYDYLKVFLTPATVEFTAGATSSNTQSSYTYSENAFDFNDYLSQTGNSSYPYKLSLTQGNTLHIDMNVVNPDPNGSAKIVFLWRNDGSSGTQPGAIIRNFSIEANGSSPVVTDPTVATNAATNIAQTTATLSATITNPDNVTITAKGFEWKATTGGTYTQIVGTGTDNTFTADLSGLTANTSYTYKAFITFNSTTVYGSEMSFTTLENNIPPGDALPCPGHETVTDYDGNVYNTVKIGEQCWMKENLRVTHYEDGTALVLGTTTSDTEPYYYDYSSSPIPLADRGYLYNWLAVMHGTNSSSTNPSNVQGVCPDGWHVPSYEEWTQLASYVSSQNEYTCAGNSSDIAKALASTEGWDISSGECYPGDQSVHANNTTGFSGIPAGYYRNDPSLSGSIAIFWSSSSSDSNPNGAYCYRLSSGHSTLNVFYNSKSDGHSVRCVLGEGCTTQNTEFSETSCGDYTWNGQTYTQSGDYTQTFTNAAGCDSVVTLHLTISPIYNVTESREVCIAALPYDWNGVTFYETSTQTATLTASNGCDSVITMLLTVIPNPVVNITRFADYPLTVCVGGSTALQANVTGNSDENSYQWYKNGIILSGENSQILNIPNLTYNVDDIYSVEISQSNISCSNMASVNINTLVSVIPIYTTNITGIDNVCEGGTVTLTATVNGVTAGDMLSYQWYRVTSGYPNIIDGATSSSYETSNLLLAGSYDYYVEVSSSIPGCSVTSPTVPANVVPDPTVSLQGDNSVCVGSSLTLNAFISGGTTDSEYTYTWEWVGSVAGQTITSTPFLSHDANYPLDSPLYFTVTISRDDNTGCNATSSIHTVNVQNTFVVTISETACGSYTWNGQTYTQSGDYTQTFTSTGGCDSIVTLHLTIVAAPTLTLSTDHSTMCAGGTTTLSATVNASPLIPNNFNYEWIVDNGTPIPGVTSSYDLTLNAAGIHTIQARISQNDSPGCTSDLSYPIIVQVAEQPIVSLSPVDNNTICEGGSITLDATVSNYNNTINGVTNSGIYGVLTFDWYDNGVAVTQDIVINNATNQQIYTLNTVGDHHYSVAVTTSGHNCLTQVSNNEDVSVVNDPSWTNVSVSGSNNSHLCLGETISLTAWIQGGVFNEMGTDGYIQWMVTDANGMTSNVTSGIGGNAYDIPSDTGTFVYTPTYIGDIGYGCQLTNPDDALVEITVSPLPTARFTSGNGTQLCDNDPNASAQLTIEFTGVPPFSCQIMDNYHNITTYFSTPNNNYSFYVAPSVTTS